MESAHIPFLSTGAIATTSPEERKREVARETHCIEFGPMRIGVSSVIAFAFFNVSGGPWGSEDIFADSSPLLGCVGIVLFTVLFCVPQCLLTSELCCALPKNGGYAVWVRDALGDFWGVQEVYWQWVSGVADAAVYPVLLCDTVMQLLGRAEAASTFEVWSWRMLATSLMSIPTFASFHFVPGLLIVFAAGTALPVLAFLGYGATMLDVRVWAQPARGPLRLGKLVNSIFWNLEGWDAISTCTALVQQPREATIPKGLFLSLAASSLQYMLVLLVAAGVGQQVDPWYRWTDGSIPNIGASMGPWMGVWMFFASAVGNAGMYLSEFVEDAYLLQGAAEAQIAPRVFRHLLPITKAPFVAIIFQFAIISVMVVFDFSDLIVFDNFFTGMAVLLQFVSFFVLRWQRPDLPRPFRVSPLGVALFVPALAILAFMLFHCFVKAGNASLVTAVAFALGTPYGFWVARREKHCKRCGTTSGLDELFQGR